MIFVTVGTHEQPFNRLIECMDQSVETEDITEEVMIQTGYSTYEPKCCKWKKFLSYREMQKNIERARIVITHGGPSSFIAPLRIGKIPIVVPRRHEFNEHVNDHQLEFCREVAKCQQSIIVIEDVREIKEIINRYEEMIVGMRRESKDNNKKFCEGFTKIVDGLFSSSQDI